VTDRESPYTAAVSVKLNLRERKKKGKKRDMVKKYVFYLFKNLK